MAGVCLSFSPYPFPASFSELEFFEGVRRDIDRRNRPLLFANVWMRGRQQPRLFCGFRDKNRPHNKIAGLP